MSYQYVTTDYKQDTRAAFDVVPPITYSPGGYILAGKYDSHIYSLGTTLTPVSRLLFSGTFSYQDTSTATPNAGLIPAYKGHVYSLLASGTYIFNEATDLSLTYSFSMADYSQDEFPLNPSSPPPLGIRYHQHAVQAALSHRINRHFSTRLQYGFFYYDEPMLAGVNDYQAHTVVGSLTYHFH